MLSAGGSRVVGSACAIREIKVSLSSARLISVGFSAEEVLEGVHVPSPNMSLNTGEIIVKSARLVWIAFPSEETRRTSPKPPNDSVVKVL